MDTSPSPIPRVRNSSLAIWSLVLGLLSIVLLICTGPFFAIPAVICGHMAHARIKRSGGALGGQTIALTGLITGYVSIGLSILIIPIMAAIAIPNFVKGRDIAQRNICIRNLQSIEGAKQQWAFDNNKTTNDIPTAQDLDKYLSAGFASLHCPKGGVYTINKVGESAECSIPTHQLP